ncbi:MAG: cupin domain-containing protein [Chloroflexaceae bacterium]|jgi:quercetin dioxygenase-like cupin family protein|nr:cupin domain-containing protein [Chloroflexaceae bacterium]
MTLPYTHIANLGDHLAVQPGSTISSTIYVDEGVKVVLFGFAAGQELSEHTASMPALLHFIAGTATVTLGPDTIEAVPNTWVRMAPHLPHSIVAHTDVVMLLTLLKSGREAGDATTS